MEEKKFKPFIPADRILPEITPVSIVLGILLAVLFGAANAYLGLRVGMTISASIPAAVISMGIIRIIMKRDSILENNMVQTIGSAGESLAAGAIFTLPALFMWAKESNAISKPSFWVIATVSLCAAILGLIFMVPLRSALIVEEHGVLPFPEGTACAEVLLAGEEGGEKSKLVFSGLGISTLYKFIADGIKLFPSEIDWSIKSIGSGFGADILPSLAGVGFICGKKISAYLFAGGILGWFVAIPLINLFGGTIQIAPAKVPVNELGVWGVWSNYIRYVGAGAVATGGIISLIKSLPTIIKTFKKAVGGFGHKEATEERTNRDLSTKFLLILALIIVVVIWLLPAIPVGLLGALIIVLFGFFFATVSSRMVGIVGSSNNPVSGMTIATLIIATALLKSTGHTGVAGMISAICIGTIICIIACMAGDISQDLKTGYIVGATPKNQQIGELIGSVAAALAIGGIMFLLDKAWGFGSKELPAPQATLMKLVVEGVMGGNLPWGLVITGAGIGIAIEVIGIPVLPVAVGLYLPIHLSTPIFIGGLLRAWFDKKGEAGKEAGENGVLFGSGLIAGEGLMGIILALLAIIPVSKGVSVLSTIDMGGKLGNAGGLIFFIALMALFYVFSKKKIKK
ncbi:putative oligopeptide transporter, OPT family [Treponema sp. JC4]|uniref:OPT family oligopeptide transporter n=1 Tax=Treponema sp. JC4 TaxID=1124982 RepID=UPI00025B0ABD|nr:oligopeptide transporter, OPT family [Treponema sp. JC4]EID84631.1 putative oligopeptide transporter, OPT family [Treponema sp. JC4]